MLNARRAMAALATGLSVALLAAAPGLAAKPAKPAPHRQVQAKRVTAAQAQAAALKKFPGKVVGKTKLENEEGALQYSVTVRSGKTLREVMVDAHTGKIASVEVTSAKEERAEAKADAAKAKASRSKSAKAGGAHGKSRPAGK